jgi:hypothetical protein
MSVRGAPAYSQLWMKQSQIKREEEKKKKKRRERQRGSCIL